MARDPYKYFRIEAREILEELTRGLLELETRADAELVARLLRHAHTLKGAARIVKHRELADLSHALEDALEPLRDKPVAQRQSAALALLDQMAAAVTALPAADAVASPGATTPAPRDEAPLLVRSDTAALDELIAGLGEVQTLVARLRGAPDPAVLIEQLDRELGSVRHDAERLRLVPASSLLTALERTARDAAVATGKQVTFAARGGDVRIDAPVLATLHRAIVQLVRNAVAHGIELPERRVASSKPANGHIAIAIRLEGRNVVASCDDDGSGFDLEAVRRAAVARGLAHARDLDEAGLVEVLLRGGLTTRAEASALAGRGIGLDVVREVARELGGTVAARSRPGLGTTIAITVPITIGAIAVVSMEAGDRTAAIPLDAIRRVTRLQATEVLHGPEGSTLAFDDVMIPYAPLARILGGHATAARFSAIIDVGDGLVGLGVTRILGVTESVLRAVPDGAPIDPVVYAITLDEAGLPRPVLDPVALGASVRRVGDVVAAPVARPLPILVVDDSLTTRMLEQSILESAGYDVELASSAEEGLAKVAAREYSLCLVDVEMPGMDGFSFIAELRTRPASAHIPAILVTSRNAPEDLRRGAAVGARGYIVKGEFDQVALVGLIRTLVRP